MHLWSELSARGARFFRARWPIFRCEVDFSSARELVPCAGGPRVARSPQLSGTTESAVRSSPAGPDSRGEFLSTTKASFPCHTKGHRRSRTLTSRGQFSTSEKRQVGISTLEDLTFVGRLSDVCRTRKHRFPGGDGGDGVRNVPDTSVTFRRHVWTQPEIALGRMLAGLSTRRYGAGAEPMGDIRSKATSRSAVSRRFKAGTQAKLGRGLRPRPFDA